MTTKPTSEGRGLLPQILGGGGVLIMVIGVVGWFTSGLKDTAEKSLKELEKSNEILTSTRLEMQQIRTATEVNGERIKSTNQRVDALAESQRELATLLRDLLTRKDEKK